MNRILGSLVLVAIVIGHSVSAEELRPHIIYVLVDDLGYADCGFNGGTDIQTPNIDGLARSGAILKSYYVQPVCSPTRAALMTGRYATHTGVYTVVRPGAPWGLPLSEQTLPQALREAGYTSAICGKWHLGEFQSEYTPTHRGFDHQYGHMFGAIDYFDHTRDGKTDWYRNDKPLAEEGYSTTLIGKEASRIIREQPVDKPLFLYVAFNGIHAPHQVPKSYVEPYERLPELRGKIAGMLSAVDEAVGQIVAAVEEKGLREKTLIVFSSDNGGPAPGKATMNTPLRAGKGTLYEGGIRVCSFAAWPGKIPAGVSIDEPLHAVDWYPTLVKLTGAAASQKHAPDGLDIWPVLTQGAKSPHDALLIPGSSPRRMALRMGDWKLLLNASEQDAEESPGVDSATGKMELYNLAEDISERHNLVASQPERVKELRARLDELIKDAVPAGEPSVGSATKGSKRKGKR